MPELIAGSGVTLTLSGPNLTVAAVPPVASVNARTGAVVLAPADLTMNSVRVLGRTTAASGAVEELKAGAGIAFIGGEIVADGLDGAGAPDAASPIADGTIINVIEGGANYRKLSFAALRTHLRAILLDQRAPAGADTPTQADNARLVRVGSAAAVNVTLPNLSVGTVIQFEQAGAGKVTFVGASGVSVRQREGRTRTPGQYALVTAVQVAANEWRLTGDLESAA